MQRHVTSFIIFLLIPSRSFPSMKRILSFSRISLSCVNSGRLLEMVLWIVLEVRDGWDCGAGLRGQSNQCWCYIPPSENSSGRKCLLPLSRFSTHLHPSPINRLLYLHLAAATKWMFALKGINVSLFASFYHFFLSIFLFDSCRLSLPSPSLSAFFLSFMYFSLSPSLHVCPRSSLPSSPPPSPPLWNAEMKIIGEVSKMQIVWVC